jgi:diaminohydroxyphosphoribosylaminopyrimidine deaminase/5-amino-6-(5-phosphoribosylamino)uracil reductase
VDAIAVGAGTMLADDPLLTARGAYRFRPLTRVIFDWRLRVPPEARVFSTLADGPVIMMVSAECARRREDHLHRLAARGVEVLVQGTPSLADCLSALGARNLLTLLVEGGPALQQALFAAGLVDRAQMVTTPSVLGTGLRMAPAFDVARAHASVTTRTLGHDELMEFDVHRID